jgi:hypothetical protein
MVKKKQQPPPPFSFLRLVKSLEKQGDFAILKNSGIPARALLNSSRVGNTRARAVGFFEMPVSGGVLILIVILISLTQ